MYVFSLFLEIVSDKTDVKELHAISEGNFVVIVPIPLL